MSTAAPVPGRPRRSLLGVPALDPTARANALASRADVLMLDLESSVDPPRKADAREQVAAFLSDAAVRGPGGNREAVVRVNAVDSAWFADDLAAACSAGADGIVLPEVRSAADLVTLARSMENAGAAPHVAIWSMLETAEAILDARELCLATPRLTAVVVGTNDLARALRVQVTPARGPLLTALSWSVVAARATGLSVIDGSFADPDDHDGLGAEARQGRALGFDGKTLVHHRQVDATNATFA